MLLHAESLVEKRATNPSNIITIIFIYIYLFTTTTAGRSSVTDYNTVSTSLFAGSEMNAHGFIIGRGTVSLLLRTCTVCCVT